MVIDVQSAVTGKEEKTPAIGKKGMVVSVDNGASQIGIEILKKVGMRSMQLWQWVLLWR